MRVAGKKVSIIIPAYNAEPWIGAALQSALNQTWPHTEIIVVDDGSTDNTLALTRTYESSRLKVVSQQNRGAPAARNRALREAQGDYLQYLDDDDLLSPDKIEAQVRMLQEGPPRCLALGSALYFQDGHHPDSGKLEPWTLCGADDPVNWLIDLWGPDGPPGMVPPGAWLTPRSVAEAAGPWDESVRTPDDDGEYFARVVLACCRILFCPKGCFYHRTFAERTNYGDSATEASQRGRLHSYDREAETLLRHSDIPRAKRALANRYMNLAVHSYPDYPTVAEQAAQRAQALGGATHFPFSWKGEVLRRVVGWKGARRLRAWCFQMRELSGKGRGTARSPVDPERSLPWNP